MKTQNEYLKLNPTNDVFGVEMYGAVKKKKLTEDDLFSNLVHIYL